MLTDETFGTPNAAIRKYGGWVVVRYHSDPPVVGQPIPVSDTYTLHYYELKQFYHPQEGQYWQYVQL